MKKNDMFVDLKALHAEVTGSLFLCTARFTNENTLKFIAETFSGNQILLFTCSHREEEILNRIDKEYQLIKLNSWTFNVFGV